MLSWIHPSQHPKDILTGSDVFAQLTAESAYTVVYNGPHPSPQKIAPPHEGSGPHLIHGSLGPSESTSLVQHFCMAHDRERQTDRQTDNATAELYFITSECVLQTDLYLADGRLASVLQFVGRLSQTESVEPLQLLC